MPARHLREQIGRRRRHDDEVGVARQPDVADLALVVEVEQVGEHALVGERADRERRHEFLRRLREHGAHAHIPLAQAPDEVETFIGGDAAADDEENPLHGFSNRQSKTGACSRHRPEPYS